MSRSSNDPVRGASAQVAFICQSCHHPLLLDHSFFQIKRDLAEELTALPQSQESTEGPICHMENVQAIDVRNDGSQVEIHLVPEPPVKPTSNDFTLLGESEPATGENLSVMLKVTAHLFDVMSGASNVDHPLCEECTDSLLDMLDQQLRSTEDECKDYKVFIEKLEAEGSEDESKLDAKLEKLQIEQDELIKHLKQAEEERREVKNSLSAQKERLRQLNEDEIRYYREYNEYKRQLNEYDDAQRSVENQLKYAQNQLDKLKKTNVFNTTFHIWHKDHFGTINNFRLGRLPSVPVDWTEINAAWGQTVLLLNALANKMSLKFQRYKLVPYGSFSHLESLSDKSKELPLYGSGGFRFFWDSKFDQAMVAFLDCLQQFKEEVEKGDASFSLPYKMSRGKIEDPTTGQSYSVKIQLNSEEQWTKALKFMLTNLKWGLAWVSSTYAQK